MTIDNYDKIHDAIQEALGDASTYANAVKNQRLRVKAHSKQGTLQQVQQIDSYLKELRQIGNKHDLEMIASNQPLLYQAENLLKQGTYDNCLSAIGQLHQVSRNLNNTMSTHIPPVHPQPDQGLPGHSVTSVKPPKKSSRTEKWLWIVFGIAFGIIAIIVLGGMLNNHRSSAPKQNTQPKTEQPAQNNSQDKAKAQQASQDENKLRIEMQQIKLQENYQQKLLNAYEQQSLKSQINEYNTIQKIMHYAPGNATKRTVVKHFVEHNLKNFKSQNKGSQQQ